MAHQIPSSEPDSLRAGDTWTWARGDLSDYPASVWTLTYYFRNSTAFFDVVAAQDGEAFAVSVPAAATAAYTAGRYDWTAVVSDGVDRYQVDIGVIEVLADVSSAAPYDGRSLPRILLDAVEATLQNRASADQIDLLASTIGDRSRTRDPGYLLKYRAQLQQEIRRLEGSGGMNGVAVRFVDG